MDMILLDVYSLIRPEPGLILWTTIIFILLWIILGKYAFKPISDALRRRENNIEEALKSAEKAREEMQALQSKNEALLKEAHEERSRILKEAKEMKDKIVSEAKDKAKAEYEKIAADSRAELENQKNEAKFELKSFAGDLALQIAGRVIKKELKDDQDQKEFVEKLLFDLENQQN